MSGIKLVRVYDARAGKPENEFVSKTCTGPDQPSVFLVDRLWPRGIAKADLPHDLWLKDAGPSTELRKWFGHDPDKFDEFTSRYLTELANRKDALEPLIDAAGAREVVLLFSAKDTEHNQAVVLKDWLTRRS
ncbi:MAG TPA: DUF488 family protein [Beutenbergiaceae bacterium]|nr:DUF488 family protein [Beutenbergiaceae bacterium]